jgi:hypothetical protein
MTKERKIVLITEVIEQKLRKEKELEFYIEQLKELERKIGYLKSEVALTNTIIDMIKSESMIDIEQNMLEDYDQYLLDFNKSNKNTEE